MPTRYQDRTNSEMYESFKDECREKVKDEMTKHANDMIKKLTNRKESADKQQRLDYANSLKDLFPSFDWYIKQRPPETKPLTDHTTGLCHLCESAKINFKTIVQAAKSKCDCGTKLCPNWYCVCPIPDHDNDAVECYCSSCECEDCISCQVMYTITLSIYLYWFCTGVHLGQPEHF